jgi:hypothetical protein
MPARIALVHAMRASMAPIGAAFARAWPEAHLAQLLDDALPADLERAGGVDAAMERRFVALARYAVDAGAEAVLFSCSAFGRAIDAARDAVAVPVMKPNEAMVAAAVADGAPILLLATFAPTLDSMLPEFEAEAARQGRVLDLRVAHVPGALAAGRRCWPWRSSPWRARPGGSARRPQAPCSRRRTRRWPSCSGGGLRTQLGPHPTHPARARGIQGTGTKARSPRTPPFWAGHPVIPRRSFWGGSPFGYKH